MPDPSDASVRALAHRILERPEYIATPHDIWWQRAMRWLIDWLSHIGALHETAPALFWLIVAALAVILIALLAHVISAVAAALGAPEPAEAPSQAELPRRDLRGEAESLAAAGSYLEAAHRLMLACFAMLAERRLIELRPDRSNRWIRATIRRSALSAPMAAEIDSLVEGTERRWFGRREDDPEIYDRWRSAIARLWGDAQ